MPRVITSNGYMIGYELAGAGEATPIVFLHGVGSDKSAWAPQLEHFGEERRAVAFDYPGYGDSDPAPSGTTRDDYAWAILSAMHELGIDRAHVCGLSLGGVVAIAMAHHAPERCASLILADTFAVHPDGRAIYERSIAASEDLRAMAEARVDVLLAEPTDPALRSEVVETMARIDPAAYRIGAEAVWLADQRDRAKDIANPALVLCGADDRVTPSALSEELARLIPGAQLELIYDAGHLSNMERPDDFNRIVDEFIGDLNEDSEKLDAPLREELVTAREKIIAQLNELNYEAKPTFSARGGPPDNRPLIAELENELREIDELLATDKDRRPE